MKLKKQKADGNKTKSLPPGEGFREGVSKVEYRGFEPLTYRLRTYRSTN